jgi:hypothetical protein
MADNINKFLRNIKASNSSPVVSSFSGMGTNKWVFAVAVIFMILLILILIHFLVTPVFKTKMGSKGMIPLPTSPEGEFLWINDLSGASQTTAGTIIEGKSNNYSISMDILIEKANGSSTSSFRNIFAIEDSATDGSGNATTINEQIGLFNLAIYLDKTRNDLFVSALDTDKSIKSIKIKNVPIRQPFRLVATIGDKYMDTYIDGYLAGSVTFSSALHTGSATITGPSSDCPYIRVKQVKAFDRALHPAEAKDIKPGMAKFNLSEIPADSTSCAAENFVNVPDAFAKPL